MEGVVETIRKSTGHKMGYKIAQSPVHLLWAKPLLRPRLKTRLLFYA